MRRYYQPVPVQLVYKWDAPLDDEDDARGAFVVCLPMPARVRILHCIPSSGDLKFESALFRRKLAAFVQKHGLIDPTEEQLRRLENDVAQKVAQQPRRLPSQLGKTRELFIIEPALVLETTEKRPVERQPTPASPEIIIEERGPSAAAQQPPPAGYNKGILHIEWKKLPKKDVNRGRPAAATCTAIFSGVLTLTYKLGAAAGGEPILEYDGGLALAAIKKATQFKRFPIPTGTQLEHMAQHALALIRLISQEHLEGINSKTWKEDNAFAANHLSRQTTPTVSATPPRPAIPSGAPRIRCRVVIKWLAPTKNEKVTGRKPFAYIFPKFSEGYFELMYRLGVEPGTGVAMNDYLPEVVEPVIKAFTETHDLSMPTNAELRDLSAAAQLQIMDFDTFSKSDSKVIEAAFYVYRLSPGPRANTTSSPSPVQRKNGNVTIVLDEDDEDSKGKGEADDSFDRAKRFVESNKRDWQILNEEEEKDEEEDEEEEKEDSDDAYAREMEDEMAGMERANYEGTDDESSYSKRARLAAGDTPNRQPDLVSPTQRLPEPMDEADDVPAFGDFPDSQGVPFFGDYPASQSPTTLQHDVVLEAASLSTTSFQDGSIVTCVSRADGGTDITGCIVKPHAAPKKIAGTGLSIAHVHAVAHTPKFATVALLTSAYQGSAVNYFVVRFYYGAGKLVYARPMVPGAWGRADAYRLFMAGSLVVWNMTKAEVHVFPFDVAAYEKNAQPAELQPLLRFEHVRHASANCVLTPTKIVPLDGGMEMNIEPQIRETDTCAANDQCAVVQVRKERTSDKMRITMIVEGQAGAHAFTHEAIRDSIASRVAICRRTAVVVLLNQKTLQTRLLFFRMGEGGDVTMLDTEQMNWAPLPGTGDSPLHALHYTRDYVLTQTVDGTIRITRLEQNLEYVFLASQLARFVL